MHAALTLLVALLGCYNEEKFSEDLNTTYCDYVERCFPDDNLCTDGEPVLDLTPDCGDDGVDRERASYCLEFLETQECDSEEATIAKECLEPCVGDGE
jgi:hypothetical protein